MGCRNYSSIGKWKVGRYHGPSRDILGFNRFSSATATIRRVFVLDLVTGEARRGTIILW